MVRRVKSSLEWFLSALTIGYVVAVALMAAYVFFVSKLDLHAHPVVSVVVLTALLSALFVLGMVAFFDDPAVFFRGLIDRRDQRLGQVRYVLDTSYRPRWYN